jgi:hypothetical protein
MRLAATAIAVLLLAVGAACDGDDDESASTTDGSTRTTVYLARDGVVGTAAREIPLDDADRLSLLEVLEGPTAEEAAAGLTTAIPDGTTLDELAVADGEAVVELSPPLDDGDELAKAQVVYTLTGTPNVTSVRFGADGEPLTREDFEEQTPAILVETPAVGDAVTSPINIVGTANTFEANFEYEVLAPDGEKLAGTFVTATCGTGCRGTFDEQVTFDAGDADQVRLVVFERSAENGERIKEVEIPLATG